jgi:hypothetical protein
MNDPAVLVLGRLALFGLTNDLLAWVYFGDEDPASTFSG